VLSMVLRETGLVVAAGIALGLAGAWAARSLLAGFVYGVGAGDPLTYLAVCAGVSGVALLAGFAAARPTTRVSPSRALATQ
jgi:putative ABC transport system permease protein